MATDLSAMIRGAVVDALGPCLRPAHPQIAPSGERPKTFDTNQVALHDDVYHDPADHRRVRKTRR